MKKGKKLEQLVSLSLLFLSQFVMYGVGLNSGQPDYLIVVGILFGLGSVVFAGLLD